MSFFIVAAVLLSVSVGLVVYSLYKREEQAETLQRKMAVAQEKFTNK